MGGSRVFGEIHSQPERSFWLHLVARNFQGLLISCSPVVAGDAATSSQRFISMNGMSPRTAGQGFLSVWTFQYGFFKTKTKTLYCCFVYALCMFLRAFMNACLHVPVDSTGMPSTCVAIRGQPLELSSLLPSWGLRGLTQANGKHLYLPSHLLALHGFLNVFI